MVLPFLSLDATYFHLSPVCNTYFYGFVKYCYIDTESSNFQPINVVAVELPSCCCFNEPRTSRGKVSMAALRLIRDSSKALLSASAVCNCDLSCSRNFFTLVKNGKMVMLPNGVIKVAKYYEKPKEKKGPSSGSWAFLAGATTGILLGAVAYFGNFHHNLYVFAYSP